MKTFYMMLATCVMLALAGGAFAQAKAAAAENDLAKILDMNPQDLEKMIRKAAQARLTAERDQVAAEIRDSVLFDPDQKEPAVAILEDKPANTQKDNIDRICKAFAKVDTHFGKAYALYSGGKYEQAAEALKKIVNNKEVSYFSAARSFLLADARRCLAAGQLADPKVVADPAANKAARKLMYDAADGYKELVAAMPDRLSFTAAAALNCAEAYEQLGRFIFAMQQYEFCVKNFAMTLDGEQLDSIAKKVEATQKIFKDPLASVSGMMNDVQDRLGREDSGAATRQKQKEIIAILEDLIRTAQEQQPPDGNGDTKPPPDGSTPDGTKPPHPPRGNKDDVRNPKDPARTAALVGGTPERPRKLAALHDSSDDARWAGWPKAQRDKLMEVRGKVLSERHRSQIEAYFEATSSEGRNR